MKKKSIHHISILFSILFIILFFISFFVGAQNDSLKIAPPNSGKTPPQYAEGEVLVKFKKGVSTSYAKSVAASLSLSVMRNYRAITKVDGSEYAHLKSTFKTTDQIVQELRNLPEIETVSPNYRVRVADTTPNDPRFSELWGLNNTGQTGGTADVDIDAPEAWDITTGSPSVIIAVIDTGIDYNHPDLAANVWVNPNEVENGLDDDGNGFIDDMHGINAITITGDPYDDEGHGTHCSGTIGAVGNNSLGVAGVNWDVKIIGTKFLDETGSGLTSDALTCINYITDLRTTYSQNIVAVNASYGGGGYSATMESAITAMSTAGIVFCAAAGNDGTNNDASPFYPSSYTCSNIIAVTAVDHDGDQWYNYGATRVDLGAPGYNILSTTRGIYAPAWGDLFFDDMESGSGNWTTGGTYNTWAITTDQELFANPSFPVPSPPNFWSDSPGANYVSYTDSWLKVGYDIDLSSYVGQDVYIGFGSAMYIEPSYDHAYVEVSGNGSTWTSLMDFSGYAYYWQNPYTYLIPDSVKTANFRFRFHLDTDSSVEYPGWLIDDVGIGTSITYGYGLSSGTSMAAPHVTGAVALVASQFPSETVSDRIDRILNSAVPLSSLSGLCVTGGLLNVYQALQYSVHSVSTPDTPTGTTNGMINTSYTYTTGGSTCSEGHAVEYRFDWDDGSYSSWSSSTSASHSWTSTNTYTVKAQARCATNNDIVSAWSEGLDVTIVTCISPSAPTSPSPANGATGVSLDTGLNWSICTNTDSYDVYFGASFPPPYVATVTSTSYTPGTLNYSTQYFWKIVAANPCGSTEGPDWNFTTVLPPPEPEINIKYDTTDIPDGGSYDFGSQGVGTHTDVTFTIENTGTADLTLSGSPIIVITGTDADQFSVEQQPTSPVASGNSTTFIIRFSPTSDGSKTASISIANNDSDENPYDITLNGTGVITTGSLTVTIAPQGARDAGARWRRICTVTWHESGYTESDIPAGDVIVEFKDIVSWITPEIQTVAITAGGTESVLGTYTHVSGSGIFIDSGESLGSAYSMSVALGDVDGDGDLDAFVTNDKANKLWLNDGAGAFIDSGQSIGSGSIYGALGDVDCDGDLDAFVANNGANKVWLNDGSATFTDSGQSLGGADSGGVTLGDVDGDGDLDAFVTNYGANKVWLNDGSGTFSDSGQNIGSAHSVSVALGDVDGDGDLDAFVTNFEPFPANKVWLNDGSGTFSDSGQSLGSSNSQSVVLGDVDGDNDIDAFVANYYDTPNKVWLNDGSGTFSDSGQNLGSADSVGMALGDIDGDGDLDAFVTNYTLAPNKVWLNDGSGVFTDSGQSLGSANSRRVTLGDVDGDNDLDAFVTNYGANKLWLNECTPPSITTQPQSQAIGCDTSTTLSVTATGTEPLFYQWYQGASGDTSTPVGTDSSSYTTPNLITTTSYWVRVSNACGSGDSETATITVSLPSAPSDPFPANGATGVSLDSTLTWTSPDAGSWDVYFGTSFPPPYAATVNTTSYTPSTLNYSTQYFWKIVAANSCGSTEGPEWNFTTVLPPPEPEINIKYDTTDIPDGGSYDFSSQGVGTDTDVTFTIENTGTADLTLSGSPIIAIAGTDADQFSVEQQPTSPVASGNSTTFIIRFSPTSDGAKTASISIANNDSDENPYDITLNGTGVITTGSLTVTIEPEGARNAGARWRRICTVMWYESGYTESGIPAGDVIVEFKDIVGWIKPANQTATITAGGTTNVTGTYTKLGGPGTFIDSGQSLGNAYSNDVALGDLDSDGDLDAFVANGGSVGCRIWLNDGLGNFIDSGQILGSSIGNGVALGDVDCDGDLDAFVANNGANKVWLNDGSGVFTDSGQSLGSALSRRVALGDFDGDGDLDAFVANSNVQPNKVWLNDGTGTFTDSGQNLSSAESHGVALGDVDGDGDLDAFVANAQPKANKVWLNDGTGTFADSGQSLGDAFSNGVALGDIDSDGDLDAIVANAGSNKVWLNDGSGLFTDSGQSLISAYDMDVALGDVDGDGDLDALIINGVTYEANKVWLNDGFGAFSNSGQSLGSTESLGVSLGDVDGDGDLDSFIANSGGLANKVWLNECTPPSITTQPQSQTIGCNTSTTLSVTATGTEPLSYEWYQGTSGDTSTPVGTDSSSYNTPNLTAATSYWVRISNACGSVDSDTATITVSLPSAPSDPFPANGATGVSLDPTLTWASPDAASWDVYFGTSFPPPYVATVTTTSYTPGTLNYSTQYFWKIVAANPCGSTEGPEWNFTTVLPPPEPEINIKYDTTDIPDGGSYDFGSHDVGTDTDVTFTIENTGTADLTLSGSPIIAIAGTDADQFSVEQQPTSPVASGNSTTFIIRFSPTSEGAKTASISIANNDSDENPYDITLDGTGSDINKEDLLGTWDSLGVWYRNSEDGSWVKMSIPAQMLAAGDLDGDNTSDLIGVWSSGLWVKYSSSGSWARLTTLLPSDIASGDMNGDGRDDVLGTWSSGVWYKNSATGVWVKMSAVSADLVAAGDLDGDNTDDLVGVWSSGLWVKHSSTGTWAKLTSILPSDIASGDMNGDGRDDLLGTWSSGVWYKDSVTGTWVKMSAVSAYLVTAGDIDGDGTDDLIGTWSSGLWVKYSETGTWQKICTPLPSDIDAGLFRTGWGAGAMSYDAPIRGVYVEGPDSIDDYLDLSSEGPGGWNFAFQVEENLILQEKGLKIMMRIPGPEEPGFKYIEQKNLIPKEGKEKKRGKKKKG